jgi:UDP-N-acetylglucosamine 2-epimerase (non-hydrolysing)
MKSVMLVFGTRPEAIKMAPLVKEFQKHPEKVKTIVCVTGQHRQMLDQVLEIFDIKPDYDLAIMKPGQDLYDVTSRVLTGMRDVLNEAKPDVVLVHGDTTTSMGAALAAYYRQIPVGHVEAGLRTHNIYSPWPEEMNRQITGRIAEYNFAPTQLSRENLINEGISACKIFVTGNTVIDSLYWVVDKIKNDESLNRSLRHGLQKAGYDTLQMDVSLFSSLDTGVRISERGSFPCAVPLKLFPKNIPWWTSSTPCTSIQMFVARYTKFLEIICEGFPICFLSSPWNISRLCSLWKKLR